MPTELLAALTDLGPWGVVAALIVSIVWFAKPKNDPVSKLEIRLSLIEDRLSRIEDALTKADLATLRVRLEQLWSER